MPPQIPHPNTALHLYRHILREATYLPPLARPWAFDYIRSRFRDHQQSVESKRYLKLAHRELRFLRAANSGHVDRILRICLLATGRLGKRRRQLSSTYLAKAVAEDSSALDSDAKSSRDLIHKLSLAAWGQSPDSKPGKNKYHMPATTDSSWMFRWDLEKVKLLAQSQYEAQESTTDWVKNNKIRRTLDPRTFIVRENCWGLDLKPKQMTRKLQKHWASVLQNLMPPLPQGEWDMLRALANGDAPAAIWNVPSRRPLAISSRTEEVPSMPHDGIAAWDWEKYAVEPVRKLERKNSRRMKALSGSLDEQPGRDDHPIGVRSFSARSLKRGVYSLVWQASPIIKPSQKNAKSKWSITWGALAQPTPSQPQPSDMKVFRGVDSQGKLVTPGSGGLAS